MRDVIWWGVVIDADAGGSRRERGCSCVAVRLGQRENKISGSV